MMSTAFSMFYSWQIYQVEMTTADTGGKPSEATASDENDVIHLVDAPFMLYEMQRQFRLTLVEWKNDVRNIVEKRRQSK